MRRAMSPRIVTAALVALLALLAAAPAQAGPRQMVIAGGPVYAAPAYPAPPPPPPAGYYQVPTYRYYYYPNHRVYYDLDRSLWFWMSAGAWSFGAALPPAYYGDLGTHVFFSLANPQPYVYYQQHFRSYPPVRIKRWHEPPEYGHGYHRPPPPYGRGREYHPRRHW